MLSCVRLKPLQLESDFVMGFNFLPCLLCNVLVSDNYFHGDGIASRNKNDETICVITGGRASV